VFSRDFVLCFNTFNCNFNCCKKTVILTLHECAEGEELISSSIPNNVNVFVTANRWQLSNGISRMKKKTLSTVILLNCFEKKYS